MEKEAPSVEADRDSPLAKTQRLGDISTPVHSSESQNARERDSNHAITEKTDLDASQPLVANLSNSQLDGQAEEDEEKTAGQNNFEENRTIEVAVESPKSSTFVRKTQDEPFVEIEKSKSSPIETSSVDGSEERNNIYHVKWIGWNPRSNTKEGSKRIGIITQNENGPCPLLSVVNVLLLRGKLTLPDGCEVISAEQLLEFLGDVISESVPENLADEGRLNYEQNLADAMCIMPKLQTGLDVNVHFNGVSKFEYTPECIIFDLLDIPLYHGWLIDPQQEEVCSAVNSSSYNQLVEMIIANKTSKDSELVSQSLTAQQFLEESASQLTYHGLCELNTTLKDGELAVFFRNNHFSTIYKRKQELFLLVTDQGFLKEGHVVWETLNSIDGDNQFVDENFLTVSPSTDQSSLSSRQENASPVSTQVEQIDRDLQLAMTLAREEESGAEGWDPQIGDAAGLTDEELAKRLQAEEETLAAQELQQQEQEQQQQQQQQQQQPPQQRGSTSERSRGQSSNNQPRQQQQPQSRSSRNCTIL